MNQKQTIMKKYFYVFLWASFLVSCQEDAPTSGNTPEEPPTPPAIDSMDRETDPATIIQEDTVIFADTIHKKNSATSEKVVPADTATPTDTPSSSSDPAPKKSALGKDYEVISVKGKIRNTRKQESIQAGSRIQPDDVLQFGSSTDELVLINSEKRLYTASPGADLKSYQLASLRGATQGRPGKILSYIGFQQFLKGKQWLVLGGAVDLEIGGSEFPMDAKHYFYIGYIYSGEEIPKKLKQRGNILSIEKTSLYKVDGNSINASQTSNAKLYYYNEIDETSLLINPIHLIFPNERQLKKEVGVIVNQFKGASIKREDLLDVVTQYLISKYGSPEKENLSDWLKKNFGV